MMIYILLFWMKIGNDIIKIFFHIQLLQIVRNFHINLRHYILMVSNARIYLSLQVTVWNCILIFIFQPVMRRHMLLSDVQYGRF